VKRTGDGSLVEFRSVVDAVRRAMEVQMPDETIADYISPWPVRI
jgi:hypothetical protein